MADTIKVIPCPCCKRPDCRDVNKATRELVEALAKAKVDEFNRGMIVAASDIQHLWGNRTQAEYLLSSISATRQMLDDLDMSEHDKAVLRPLLTNKDREHDTD